MLDNELPDIQWGDSLGDAAENLVSTQDTNTELDNDDDELLEKTPEDVVELLGFDPLEFEDE